MVTVTGPFDPHHPVVRRARELIAATGSAEWLAAFEATVTHPTAAAPPA